MKDQVILFTSIAAGILQLWGYYIYNKKVFGGDIKPNASSWFLWAVGSVIAAWSYVNLSDDWVKDILPITCALACVATFFVTLSAGKFSKPDAYDIWICAMDLLVVFYWLMSSSDKVDEYANALIQIDVILTFIPIVREVWRRPDSEKPLPWFIWSGAYALMTIVVLGRFEKWWDLMYPLNYLILHLLIATIVSTRAARQ